MPASSDGKCWVCGLCWWVDCPNDADYRHDVTLKRGGGFIFEGEVELCAGHTEYAARTGHINLRWEALEQALALQKANAQ